MPLIAAVTGGSGFIGSALVQALLARGDRVRVLTRDPPGTHAAETGVPRWCADLTLASPADLVPFLDGADVLYHCAGETSNEARMHALHVDGTRTLVEAAAGRTGHWVQLSSTGGYGFPRQALVTEDTPVNPISVYEATKVRSDEIVAAAADRGAFTSTVLRPSNVYGGNMRNRSLFQMIRMIDQGLFFFIGAPGAVVNYVHVSNVVDALVRCGIDKRAPGRDFIVSDHCSIEHFVELVARALGRRPPRLRLPEAPVRVAARLLGWVPHVPLTASRIDALTGRTVFASDRIRRELGYVPVLSMADSVRDLVAGWRKRS